MMDHAIVKMADVYLETVLCVFGILEELFHSANAVVNATGGDGAVGVADQYFGEDRSYYLHDAVVDDAIGIEG